MTRLLLAVALMFSVNASAQYTDSVAAARAPQSPMQRQSNRIQPTIPVNLAIPFSATMLPFFCRQEYRLEQKIGVPVRLRVGTTDQCNFYEGKLK